ncbi:MAG: ComF family protein [Candidatus Omnitrophota bacterium]
MRQLLSEISKASLNLVYPIYCEGCNAKLAYNNKSYLCHECMTKIKENSPPFCVRCGRCLSGDKDIKTICPDCVKKTYSFDAAWQCCTYDGLIKDLIHNFKYSRKLFLKNILSDILYDFLTKHINYMGLDLILAVPMHRICANKRGFNQSLLLSKELSRRLGLPYSSNCLVKTKNTRKQIALNKRMRLNNIKGAFSVKKNTDLSSKNILLIDDVFTTGATANECSLVLKKSDAKSVSVLALARGA